jgi:hypothetical protein
VPPGEPKPVSYQCHGVLEFISHQIWSPPRRPLPPRAQPLRRACVFFAHRTFTLLFTFFSDYSPFYFMSIFNFWRRHHHANLHLNRDPRRQEIPGDNVSSSVASNQVTIGPVVISIPAVVDNPTSALVSSVASSSCTCRSVSP